MGLQIVGGKHRSRMLKAPKGQNTRPTRSMVREAVFNILQGDVTQSRVLDLFAGSGAMGLEAISRGASFAVFCDSSRNAVEIIKENIALLKEQANSKVLLTDAIKALERFQKDQECFDLVFIDPPYGMDPHDVIHFIKDSSLLKAGGWLVLEQAKGHPVSLPDSFIQRLKRDYGDTTIYILGEGRSA